VTYGGSRIDNTELFSHLAVAEMKGFQSGNAAVNAWGVENIYGLVVESQFRPAQVYVTVVSEGDFYRGLAQSRGLPFFNVSPRFALAELWYFFCTQQSNKKDKHWTDYADEAQVRRVVEKATVKLKEMDTLLRHEGRTHLLFITPASPQVLGTLEKDPLVQEMLMKYGLEAVYIVDELTSYDFSDEQIGALFCDLIHLRKEGHRIWGQIIRSHLEGCLTD